MTKKAINKKEKTMENPAMKFDTQQSIGVSQAENEIVIGLLCSFQPQTAQEMTQQQLGDWLRQKILDNKTHENVSYYAESFSDADYGTTHVAVLAPNGDAVSVTTTINFR